MNEGNPNPVPLPQSISFMIGSFLLGLRVFEYMANEPEVANEAYQLFIAMLQGAMNRGRGQSVRPSAEAMG